MSRVLQLCTVLVIFNYGYTFSVAGPSAPHHNGLRPFKPVKDNYELESSAQIDEAQVESISRPRPPIFAEHLSWKPEDYFGRPEQPENLPYFPESKPQVEEPSRDQPKEFHVEFVNGSPIIVPGLANDQSNSVPVEEIPSKPQQPQPKPRPIDQHVQQQKPHPVPENNDDAFSQGHLSWRPESNLNRPQYPVETEEKPQIEELEPQPNENHNFVHNVPNLQVTNPNAQLKPRPIGGRPGQQKPPRPTVEDKKPTDDLIPTPKYPTGHREINNQRN